MINLLNFLKKSKTDFIVLAGYLKKIPADIVSEFKNRIINIHPSLLPKHGGKGMYGLNVHSAVINSTDKTSGITIHFANNDYDKGAILFQASLDLKPNETAKSLSHRTQELEHLHYAKIIEKTIDNVLKEKDISDNANNNTINNHNFFSVNA